MHQFNVNTQSRVPSAAISKYIEFWNQKTWIIGLWVRYWDGVDKTEEFIRDGVWQNLGSCVAKGFL